MLFASTMVLCSVMCAGAIMVAGISFIFIGIAKIRKAARLRREAEERERWKKFIQ